MIRTSIQSKVIKSLGYDLKTSMLEVELNGRKHLRQYLDCPQHVFIELIQAPSPGRYFLKHVKGQFEEVRIEY